ncbi:MAG: hypothetical protein HOB26_03545 [Flavobacteriales bacterium]|jgi:hypothetical protein|nr:hypothetical protein [Flavobacteriales bacterium]|tara:strand:- start:165 stop:359 length:195 start_codon:yes stop_codon:yes gene_type:complete
MDDVKGLLQSRTVWGALLAITATISQLFGWDLGDTNGLAEQVAALAGGVIAVFGRIKAVKRIAK